MRILLFQLLSYLFASGGAHKANRILIEGLAERGHSCQVVTGATHKPGPETHAQFLNGLAERGIQIVSSTDSVIVFHHKGVEVHAVTDGFSLVGRFVDQVRELDPTWVLVSEDRSYTLLEIALEVSPGQVVCVSHSQATLPFGPESMVPDPTKTELLRRTTGIITVSNHVRDYIRKWGNLEAAVIRFPVYGSGPFPYLGQFDAGFVTMINPSAIKGISIFLELARRLPDIRFAAVPTWATTSEDRAALEQLPNMQFLKPSDNVNDIFAQTRILVVPSLWGESFGQIVVEAMLCGIPVLASNVGGLPEAKLGVDYVLPVRAIERYHETFDEQLLPVPVVPPQDVDPWLEALEILLSDRVRYEQLSRTSREAALVYISSLGIEPFENYLESLVPVSQAGRDHVSAQARMKGEAKGNSAEFLKNLSPQRRALLALRLKEIRQQ